MITRRQLRAQLDAANTRTAKAVEDRNKAYSARDTALGNEQRMAGQLSDVREELAALHRTGSDPAAWAAERQELRRRLFLSDGARERLTRQLEQVQAANEALCEAAAARAAQDEEAMTA